MKTKFLFFLFFVSSLWAKSVYFVVLAGGVGERLWPLSRKTFPKQFLSFDGKKSLLEITIDRIDGIVEHDFKWIVTTKSYEELVKKYVGNRISDILVEPALRNTGPAICLAAMKIAQKDPDAILVFLASDHFIQPVSEFRKTLKIAIDYAEHHEEIILLGIKPTYPAVGYGYIQVKENNTNSSVMNVVGFYEKPSLEKAKEYVNSGVMVWNGSYFCGKASVFVNEFKKHAIDIASGVEKYLNSEIKYESLPNISIDFSVMEKTKNLKAVLLDVDWSDVGSLPIFLALRNKFTSDQERIVSVESNDNLVFSKNNKQIVLLGVKNLCVVDTDDVLLVSKNNYVEPLKDALKVLKKSDVSLL